MSHEISLQLTTRLSTYSKMTRLSTSIAASSCTYSTNTESWAVGLDMTVALAMVALLR